MANIEEIKRLRGGDLQVAAQANVQIDAEIGPKDHFRVDTTSFEALKNGPVHRVELESGRDPAARFR